MPPTGMHPCFNSLAGFLDTVFLVNIPRSYASIVGYDPHEAGCNVSGFIVCVEEADVRLDCGGGGVGGSAMGWW